MNREKTMNRIKRLIAISVFSLLVLSLPAIASGQSRNRDRDDDRYGNGGYNNGGYGNGGYDHGQYGRNGDYGDMRSTVRSLKNNTRELQRHLDNDLDNSRYNGTRREDEINRLAKDFRNAVNRLSESNNNYGNYGRRDDKIDRVLSLGSQLDRAFSRIRVDYHIRETWSDIRNDLRVLENGYGGYNNNRYPNGNNNRYPNGNNTRRNLPSWWPF
jgi:hypothetical protein